MLRKKIECGEVESPGEDPVGTSTSSAKEKVIISNQQYFYLTQVGLNEKCRIKFEKTKQTLEFLYVN